MKKLLFFLVCAVPLFAQNSRYDSVALGPRGPIPNATVAVCTQPANTTTTPCSPLANLCSSLTDATCTSPDPVTADSLGNYHFYGKPTQGPFTIQLYGPQVVAPVAIPDQTLGGSGSSIFVQSINGIQSVSPNGGELGAQINAKITALGSQGGTIYIPAGNYTQSTLVSVTTPNISISGPNSSSVNITCTLNSACISIRMNPFGNQRAGTFGGFTLTGQGANNNSIGIDVGDTNSPIFQDLHVTGFTGTSAIGMYWHNSAGLFSERVTMLHVSLNGNTTDMKIADPSGTGPDFDYWRIVDLGLNVPASGTGIDFENGAHSNAGTWNITCNVNGLNGICWTMNGTSQFLRNLVALVGDDSSTGLAMKFWNTAAGTAVTLQGAVHLSGAGFTNTVTGTFVYLGNAVFAPASQIQLQAFSGGSPANVYNLVLTNPAANRQLTINDPLANDSFTLNAATQTLTNKSTAAGALTGTVASGTAAMTTAAITAGNCGTTVTVAATGVLTTDRITWSFNAAPAGSNAGLVSWPTANNVNFAYCPNSAETPAAATINWHVIR